MNTQISFQNIETASRPGLEASILVMVKRHVERYLARVTPTTPAELQVNVAKSRHRDYYRISIKLVLSGITLAVREEGQHLLDTVGKAFDELERELLRHIARVRQEEAWHRHEVLNHEARRSPRERPRDFTLEEQDQGVYQLWRPEEMLRMKDVAPVSEATPETSLEEQDVRAYFHDVLAKMPNNWRRAIWLTQAEGIPVAEVAQMMGTSETEIKRWVQLGDDYLRARLREAGYELAPPGKPGGGWFEPTPAVQTGLLDALDDVMQGVK
jgi:ribosome-associated translation inhibitor RaiA